MEFQRWEVDGLQIPQIQTPRFIDKVTNYMQSQSYWDLEYNDLTPFLKDLLGNGRGGKGCFKWYSSLLAED